MALLVKRLPFKHKDLNLAPPDTDVKGWVQCVSEIPALGMSTQLGSSG